MTEQHTEAQCPECNAWSRVAPTGPYIVPVDVDEDGSTVTGIVHGPWSWTDENGDANTGPATCPNCDAAVLVGNDCDFRSADESEAAP